MAMQYHATDVCSHESHRPAPMAPAEHSQTVPCIRTLSRVLVVEDDRILRDLIADVFAFEGYFVTEASDEESLLRCVHIADSSADEQFDLVVLGLQVHGSLGVDSLARLRASGCRTPAIVLSAESKTQLVPRLNELDAMLLSKPFAFENLRALANHVIHARQCGFGETS